LRSLSRPCCAALCLLRIRILLSPADLLEGGRWRIARVLGLRALEELSLALGMCSALLEREQSTPNIIV